MSNRLRLILLWGVPLLAVVIAFFIWGLGGRYVETENAYIKSDLIAIYPEVEAQVAEVFVKENMPVKPGQVILELDKVMLSIDLRRAEARLASVHEELAVLRKQYEQLRGERTLAQEQSRYAERELSRQRELVAKQLSATSRFEAAEHDAVQASGRITVIEQSMQALQVRLGGTFIATKEEHPLLRAAQAELDAAEWRLARSNILSPVSGRVVKLPEPGSMARKGVALFTLVCSEQIWIDANFKETQLVFLRPGLSVIISVDSYPGAKWIGHIDTISPASGAEFSVLPPQNASGNWVKVVQRVPVRIAVDSGPSGFTLRAGSSVAVRVDANAGTRWSRFIAGI